MFAAVGNHVEALHRDRIGALDLPADLAPGGFRLMTPEQIAAIFAPASVFAPASEFESVSNPGDA